MWITSRYLRREWAMWVALFPIAVLVALGTTMMAMVEGSSRLAVVNGAASELGGATVVVTPIRQGSIDPGLPPASMSLARIWRSEGAVRSENDRLVEASISLVSEPDLHLGTLLDGRSARSGGEATISRVVSETAGISVGDTVELLLADSTLVGTSSIAAVPIVGIHVRQHRASSADVTWVPPTPPTAAPTQMVTTAEPGAIEVDDAGVVRPVGVLVARAESEFEEAHGHRIAAIDLGLSAILLAVALGGLLVARGRLDSAVAALTGMGMRNRAASVSVGAAVAVIVVSGTLVGTIAALGLTRILAPSISPLFDQHWSSVALPGSSRILVPLLIWGVALIISSMFRTLARSSVASTLRRSSSATTGGVAAVGLLLGNYLLFVSRPLPSRLDIWIGVGAAGFCTLHLLAIATVAAPPRRRVLGLVRSQMAKASVGAASVVALVAFGVTLGAQGLLSLVAEEELSYSSDRPGFLPNGSYQVESISASSAARIDEAYQRIDGVTRRVARYADSGDRILRAVSGENLDCLAAIDGATLDDLFRCPDPLVTDVGRAIDGEEPQDTGVATSALAGDDARVGLVLANPETGEIMGFQPAEVSVDDRLFHELTEAAFAPDQLPADWELPPTRGETIALLGLSTRDPVLQAEVRSTVYPLTLGLTFNDFQGFLDGGRTAFARLALGFGALLVSLLVVVFIRTIVASFASTASVFHVIANGRRSVWRRNAIVAMLPLIVAGAVGAVQARIAVELLFPVPSTDPTWFLVLISVVVGVVASSLADRRAV